MATKLESLSTKLQSALDLANSLPDAITLDELTNPGSAATMLEGTEMLDADGKKVTGSIASKSSSNLTASGATVTVPAGYYPSQATKSVATATQAIPVVSLDADTGVVTAKATQSAGYVSAGEKSGTLQLDVKDSDDLTVVGSNFTAPAGYYPNAATASMQDAKWEDAFMNVDASGQVTYAKMVIVGGYVCGGYENYKNLQLPTQSAKTITPTKSSQTAVAAGKYTTGAVTVAPIPAQYIDTSDANATAPHILAGETAYVDGVKVTGTMVDRTSSDIETGVFIQDGSGNTCFRVAPAEGYYDGNDTKTWSLAQVVVDPTKQRQFFNAVDTGDGPYGDVIVEPIPDEYQDVSNVTATAARTAAGDVFVDADGVEQTGTLNISEIVYNDDAGDKAYVDVNGIVSNRLGVSVESVVVTPSTSSQHITPSDGKLIRSVSVGAMPTGSVGTPTITVSSAGKITATAAVNAGYVDGTDKSNTKQLTVQAAQTITPGTSNKTIASGRYLTGTQTIKGDANLVAANIISGKSIFGVAGTAVTAASLTDAATVAF